MERMDSAVSRRLTSLKAANLSWTHLDHKGKIAPNFVPFESGEACQGVETAVDVQSGLCRQGRMYLAPARSQFFPGVDFTLAGVRYAVPASIHSECTFYQA